jgi:thymidine phosphorylase
MAVFFRGMTMPERVALTRAMAGSGERIAWRALGLDGPVVDQHSTGGVGDKVSLILAPIVAACGAFVPMISGRGLGHTGGTLDKLDAIPGYDTCPSLERFAAVVRTAGCAIIGQTAALAPADRRLYAIRDVTATVESIPLITASILSKKLAAGLDALVMDVKFGNGAFMTADHDSRELAASIATVARDAGTPTTALLTDMNQVLGTTAGNALEVREAVEVLTGITQEPRLLEVTLALAAEMLLLAGLAASPEQARQRAQAALDDGGAAEYFGKMVQELGGPADFVARIDAHLPKAAVVRPAHASSAGFVTAMDTRAVGVAVLRLGGGRTRPDQQIDHAVGLSNLCQPGDPVGADRPLALVHARSEAAAAEVEAALQRAIEVGPAPPVARPVVRDRITGGEGTAS